MHSELNLDVRNKTVNSKRSISKYLEYIQGSKKTCLVLLQSRGAKWIRPTHQTRLNVFKHHLPHLHRHPLFLRRAQKASPEPPQRKSIRWALMPSTPMPQRCRFRCVMVRLIFNISAISWRNVSVKGISSISQTTHTITSTHLWTQVHRTSAPSSPQP